MLAVALPAAERPYSENRVPAIDFRYQGTWTIIGVAGEAQTYHSSRKWRHRLVGADLTIAGSRVGFRRVPFQTPVLGEVAYDTRSREFWLDFRTDPRTLNLPAHVGAVNLEMGTLLDAGNGRFLFEYYGVWFTLERAGNAAAPAAVSR